MANQDPRLQWRQLNQAQPNVSGLMAQVRGGINDAAGAAENILGRYQEGQELKSENELIRRIGGMDQEQLRTAFSKGAFDDLNLGAKGVDILNSAMGQRADVRSTNVSTDRTQASIGWGNDANSRANAGESRKATRFGWEGDDRSDKLARRDTLRELAPDYIAEEENAFRQGTPAATGNSGGLNVFAGTRADLQGTAKRPNISLDFNAVEGGGARGTEVIVPDNASPEVRAAAEQYNQRVADFAKANGIEGYDVRGVRTRSENGRGVSNTVHLEPFFNDDAAMQEAIKKDPEGWARIHQDTFGGLDANLVAPHGVNNDKGAASDIFGSETDYGMMIINSLLGKGSTPPEPKNQAQAEAAQNAAAIVQESQNPDAGRFQPTAIDRGGSNYATALAASGLFTGSEALGAVKPIRSAAVAGQEVRDKQLSDFQNDVLAGAVEDVAQSSEVLDGAEAEAMIRDLLGQQGDFSSSEIDTYARRGAEMITSSEGLNREMQGGGVPAEVSGAIEESVANTVADATRRFQGVDQNRALADIERYTEDPTANLVSDLGIGSDGENPGGLGGIFGAESGFDQNQLRNLVNEYANRFGVEPEVVAVAMRDVFDRDPVGRNTLRRRFDESRVEEAVNQLTPDDRRDYDRGQSNLRIRKNQLEQNSQQQLRTQRRLQKAQDQGDSTTVEKMLKRMETLREQAAEISTNEILQSSR